MNPTHQKFEPLICGVAVRFQKRFGGNLADLRQSAWLVFLECEKSWRPEMGVLETRAKYMIWNRLFDNWRSEQKQKQRDAGYCPTRRGFSFSDFMLELSDDAAAIARLILETGQPQRPGRIGQTYGRQIAENAGYGPDKISAAFAEISAALV